MGTATHNHRAYRTSSDLAFVAYSKRRHMIRVCVRGITSEEQHLESNILTTCVKSCVINNLCDDNVCVCECFVVTKRGANSLAV